MLRCKRGERKALWKIKSEFPKNIELYFQIATFSSIVQIVWLAEE